MKVRLFLTASATTILAMAGCASRQAEVRPATLVSVRFATPPIAERFASTLPTFGEARTVSDDVARPEENEYVVEASTTPPPSAFTVALWGGEFDGDDMTYSQTPLSPGNYTFGYWDHDQTTAMKGWINVRNTGTGLMDTLQSWKDLIPQQKQWIAYNHEIQGKLDTADASAFQTFAKQIRAFDQLERDLGEMIAHEHMMQAETQKKRTDLLSDAVVLFLPVGGDFFHPTTLPTFAPEDVALVKNGEPVTKILLVADSQDTQRKLRLVNRVCHDLVGCRTVLAEEVDRLEQRKRYYLTTDHIYKHDRKFVENELRMQQVLSAIDQLNTQVEDMRERRLALAFTSGLVAPDRLFDPIDEEHRDLAEVRTILGSKQRRFDLLFEAAHEDSPRRVVLQRARQRVSREIDNINRHMEMLDDARVALETMKNNSRIVHRQGDTKLLAASFVHPAMPFHVREAIERDAVLTVRLEKTMEGLVPSNSDIAPAQTASYVEP